MSAENGRPLRGVLNFRGTTFGEVAMAAFVLCAISGALLVPAYDAHDGRQSIAEWLLTNPGAVLLRNVHYWTAQIFLVGAVLHLWDHLRVSTEKQVTAGVWLRLVLSIPVLGFLMLSGFILRGDSDAQQAHLILKEVVFQLPLIGPLAATFLFGIGEQLHVVYVQHAATATIMVWLVIIEHVRRLWPRTVTTAVVALLVSGLALVLSPRLHDGLDLRMKGPWYFLGLQEALHWTPWPLAAVVAGVIALGLIWVLPRLSAGGARRVKLGLLIALGAYALLCVVGLFLRGENWALQPNWPDAHSDLRPGWIVSATATFPPEKLPAKLPIVMGRTEGCLVCHAGVVGLGDAHRPESIGCASCHAGDTLTLDAKRAHAGLIRVPGNLADAPHTCGQAGCHTTIIPRVERSIMTTFAGVIAVDRRVFGEPAASPSSPPHIRDLGTSAADTHLRQLCASCHLGQTKEAWGAISQESRGGGCNACHLVYSADAAKQLAHYEATLLGARKEIPKIHPALTINADNGHCFGCHSRSGRISTNYEGWHELRDPPPAAELAVDSKAAAPQFRQLDDGRFFTRAVPDVHQERGLDCIDCHTANEIMGKGSVVAHKHEQVQLRCEDCHTRQFAPTAAASLDPETKKLMQLRQWTLSPGQKLAATRPGDPLVNVVVDTDGRGRMLHKRTGQSAELRPPLAVCTQGKGHDRLSCSSCHTAWAPRCASCHTAFDRSAESFDHLSQKFVTGAWQESAGSFEATPPTLGIRTDAQDAAHPNGVVDTFVPGMILELDRNRAASQPSDPAFRRLYVRTFSHTIRREARSCESCHSDPVALGYGRGALRYVITGNTGRWQFTAEHERLVADGLPADAWVGFLQSRSGMVSTRDDVRPFTVEEQRRILRVGACLTCHAGDTPMMQRAVTDFDAMLARRGPRCVLPVWP